MWVLCSRCSKINFLGPDKDNIRARAPVPLSFNPHRLHPLLKVECSLGHRRTKQTKMAPGKWRTCLELQLYSYLTDCIELQHSGFNG